MKTDWDMNPICYFAQIIRIRMAFQATICLLGIQFNRVKNGHFRMLLLPFAVCACARVPSNIVTCNRLVNVGLLL